MTNKDLLREHYKDMTDLQFESFLHQCVTSGLDPITKQIYAIKRGNSYTTQTSIDGQRAIADSTGYYAPGKNATCTYDEDGNLFSATSYVMKRTMDGMWHEVAYTAYFKEYAASGPFWQKMPHVMLQKVAESAALRRAFPSKLNGIYIKEEMEQADSDVPETPKEKEEILSDADIFYVAFKLCENNIEEITDVHSLISYLKEKKEYFKKPVEECVTQILKSTKFQEKYNEWKSKASKE